MKRTALFALPLVIIVSLAIIVFGLVQVRFEEERLMEDLQRKAQTVAESISLAAAPVLEQDDLTGARRLVTRFQNKKNIQGCALYDKEGRQIAVTERFAGWEAGDQRYYRSALKEGEARDKIAKFGQKYVYSRVIPVEDDQGRMLGLVEMIYDTSYVFARLADFWRNIIVTLLLLDLFLIVIAALLLRWLFLPIQKLTLWFKHFQRGETEKPHGLKGQGEFGALASEVEQVALSLQVARKSAAEEAAVKLEKEDVWSEGRLRDLVCARLGSGDRSIIVASNREPFIHSLDEKTGQVRWARPASGLVAAIDPIMRACGGTWVAHGSGSGDRQSVNAKDKLGVPPDDVRYILKRVWLSPEEADGFYLGFSNEGLWPLCHITHTRPIFREADWQMYKAVNQKFADSILEELPDKNAFVFIQDYHFTLLGRLIKEQRPDAKVALFWHIPWPNHEVFSICPYQAEILDGMLGCDLIGFHVQYHCNNFLETANRLLECRIDNEKNSVIRAGKETLVRPFPISIAGISGPPAVREIAEIEKIRQAYGLAGKIVAVGVDRIDYTKGLVERFLAVDRFLEKYPEYVGKFVFLQLAAPSRTKIKRYHELEDEIEQLVGKKNAKYARDGWQPIIYLEQFFSPEEIGPYYRLGDICVVSSLHDGMNLVAKEYVAARSDLSGALVLSKFTGAARELTDAVQINPYSIEEFADAIKYAIELPPEEKQKRMENLRRQIERNNVYKWAGSIITDLTGLQKE